MITPEIRRLECAEGNRRAAWNINRRNMRLPAEGARCGAAVALETTADREFHLRSLIADGGAASNDTAPIRAVVRVCSRMAAAEHVGKIPRSIEVTGGRA